MADDDGEGNEPRLARRSDLSEARRRRDDERRSKALSLLMAGLTYDQIADQLEVSHGDVAGIIARALQSKPATGVNEMRAIENARLDRALAAIWTKVLDGDAKAISTFLSISQRRAKLNGLDAPLQIEMSANVKIEMQQALNELQEIVLGEVIEDVTDTGTDEGWPPIERGGTG